MSSVGVAWPKAVTARKVAARTAGVSIDFIIENVFFSDSEARKGVCRLLDWGTFGICGFPVSCTLMNTTRQLFLSSPEDAEACSWRFEKGR